MRQYLFSIVLIGLGACKPAIMSHLTDFNGGKGDKIIALTNTTFSKTIVDPDKMSFYDLKALENRCEIKKGTILKLTANPSEVPYAEEYVDVQVEPIPGCQYTNTSKAGNFKGIVAMSDFGDLTPKKVSYNPLPKPLQVKEIKGMVESVPSMATDFVKAPVRVITGEYKFARVKHSGREWEDEWSLFVAKAVKNHAPELLNDDVPSGTKYDIKALCPNYFKQNEKERLGFWALFFASVSYPESSYDPKTSYLEHIKIRDPKTKEEKIIKKYSRGLMQMSYDDGNGLPPGAPCTFPNKVPDLEDPQQNLECAVVKLNKQVNGKYGPKSLFTAENFYWSVLREKNKLHPVVHKVFNLNKKQLGFCGK